jgi:hypothetical protein
VPGDPGCGNAIGRSRTATLSVSGTAGGGGNGFESAGESNSGDAFARITIVACNLDEYSIVESYPGIRPLCPQNSPSWMMPNP